ncbi:hypothetical protein ACYJ1Y_13115 [Natrialbaceae archaeon A-gly3]
MAKREPRTASEEINWKRTSSGVTIYDETNPDAWIHAEFLAGVSPEHRLFMICPECGGVFAQRSPPGAVTICGDCGERFEYDALEERHDQSTG